MSQEPVLFDLADGVATVTLNRPERLNAMTDGLMNGIRGAIERVAADEAVRVVVITGKGRGFCAGADLQNAAARPDDEPPDEATPPTRGEDTFNAAMRSIHDCPVPTIARVNGAAAGGGFGLALACDITIAARSAFFVATFGPKLGIVPDMGATWSIPRHVGRARALGITLLGERIPAALAADWGLIWQVVDDDALDAEVERVAGILKRSSPATVTRIRQTQDAAAANDFSAQLDLESVHQSVLIPRNMRDGARAFLEKRDPTFGPERN